MEINPGWIRTACAAAALTIAMATGASAQVGKSQGVMDVNLAVARGVAFIFIYAAVIGL